jgi:hypothetical protein
MGFNHFCPLLSGAVPVGFTKQPADTAITMHAAYDKQDWAGRNSINAALQEQFFNEPSFKSDKGCGIGTDARG